MGKASYDSEGKRAFRALLLELARRDGLKTYGTLWGSGIDSRLFAAAGFDVTAAEMRQALHDEMRADAEAHGYSAFCGNAKRLDQRFDMFHADFCGTASPRNFEALRAISEKVDRWLAVTLSPDHQLDPSMQGESAAATLPAWLTFASGLPLMYLGQYVRNDGGQTMWCALLERRPNTRKVAYVSPATIHWSIHRRNYWASQLTYRRYPDLLPHRYGQLTPHLLEKHRISSRARWANRTEEQRQRKADYNARYRAEKRRGLMRTKCPATTALGEPCRNWARASGKCRHHEVVAP